jgi:NAD-dependent deacetylase
MTPGRIVRDRSSLYAVSTFDTLQRRLRDARSITVLTGAGVSAASGIPTFRGPGGLWRQFRAEELATPKAFARDPRLVWEWYEWRRDLIARAEPNAAHHTIARWTRERSGVTLITQNVDGLHERAGAAHVIRLHGSIWRLRCWAPCDDGAGGWDDDRVPLVPLPPRCPYCDGLARPGVVWFGEPLDPQVLGAALDACTCDLFLAVGTSAVVYPAAGLAQEARRRGAFTVEINPTATDASAHVDLAIAENAETLLPRLG